MRNNSIKRMPLLSQLLPLKRRQRNSRPRDYGKEYESPSALACMASQATLAYNADTPPLIWGVCCTKHGRAPGPPSVVKASRIKCPREYGTLAANGLAGNRDHKVAGRIGLEEPPTVTGDTCPLAHQRHWCPREYGEGILRQWPWRSWIVRPATSGRLICPLSYGADTTDAAAQRKGGRSSEGA